MNETRLNKNTIYILVILAIGLLSLTWFRGSYIINQGDFGLPLDRGKYFTYTLYVWDHSVSTAYCAPRQLIALLPHSLFAKISEMIGLSVIAYEKILFFLLFSLCGLSMYFLCSIIRLPRFACLLAAVFYMMNPFSLQSIWHIGGGFIQMGYAFAPLLLGLYIKGVKDDFSFKNVMVLAIIWTFFSSSYLNPVYAIIHWFVLLTYAVFIVIVDRDFFRVFRFTSLLLLFWLLLNLFIILPNVQTGLENAQMAGHSASSGFVSDRDTLTLNSVKLIDAFRLTGNWALNGRYKDEPYYAWGESYSKPTFILLSFLIPIIIILSLLKKKIPPDIIFFSILALIGVFLAKGVYPPLSEATARVYLGLPLLTTAFRNIFAKWGVVPALAFAPLIGNGIMVAQSKIKEYSPKISLSVTGMIVFVLLYLLVYPFWNGDVINPGGKYVPSERVKIPDYYESAKTWLSRDKGFYRVMSLPMSKNYNSAYEWRDPKINNRYGGADFMRWYSPGPVINANIDPVTNLVGKYLSRRRNTSFPKKTMALLNVKYVLLHQDTNWAAISGHDWFFAQDRKVLQAGLRDLGPPKVIGKLFFYKLRKPMPHVYCASKRKTITELKNFIPFVESNAFKPGQQVIVVSSQNKDKFVPKIEGQTQAQVLFKAINPTKYEIKIENAKEPFFLVFSESFSPHWKAYLEPEAAEEASGVKIVETYPGERAREGIYETKFTPRDASYLFREPVSEDKHFVANGYANAWYIDPGKLDKSGNGKLAMTLYFSPQSFFYLGLGISGLTLLFGICILILLSAKRAASRRLYEQKRTLKNKTAQKSNPSRFYVKN